MNICTVTSRRRIPFAMVLAESFLEHHPSGSVTAVVADAGPGELAGAESLRLLTPHALGWSQSELSRMAMIWPEKLLQRALIPDLLHLQIKESFQPALFFADDTCIYSPLDAVEALAEEAGLVLTLRSRAPLTADGFTPDQSQLLEAGLHAAGFTAVGPSAKDSLELWRDLIQTELVVSDSEVVPERILDLLSAVFPHEILSHPGSGVSFWNLAGRLIDRMPGGLEIEGSALRFFHFEGYDPEKAHLLSTEQGPRPRVLLSERADLRLLAGAYGERLLAAGFAEAATLPFGFEVLPSGLRVDKRMRRLYREQDRSAALGEGPPPPDPFDPVESDAFVSWLNAVDEDGPAPLVSRYLYALYEERGDLRAAFPGIVRVDAGRFLDWVTEYGAREVGIPSELCPPKRLLEEVAAGDPSEEKMVKGDDEQGTIESAADPPRFPFGVNAVGYFRAELGVGEMGRLILAGLEHGQIPYSTTAYSAPLSRQAHPYIQVGEEFAFDTNLFCVNADQLPSVVRDYGKSILEDRYNIGLWWWEVDVFPPQMAASAELLDEIWVGSEYVGRTIVAATDKLVRLIPIPIRRIQAVPLNREDLGIPEGFLYLCSFDFLSIFERKNPMGVIDAYKHAFRPDEGAVLLIKSINGQDHLEQLERLRVAVFDRPDIHIMDRVLSEEDKDRLVATCDCYVSLHRAEGYGLGMAEAMALAKPIIATGYSGNLIFLNETNSHLVDYKLIPVPAEAGPYPQGATWADPDIKEAAELMRSVFLDREAARVLGQKALQDALSLHTEERTARFIADRLYSISLERRARDTGSSIQSRHP